MEEVVCALNAVSKSFGKVQALHNVSLNVQKGELLALVGENGAGKTTAMGILFGLLQPDTGHVEINGQVQRLRSARDAIDAGLGMVHQHFQLYPGLTVLENVLVGQEGAPASGFLNLRSAREGVAQLITEFGFSLDPDQRVENLPVDARQQLEIVKLLYRRASVIILDEPTAVLTPQESDALYVMLKALCQQGRSVILVTHRLDEVIANADRVLVMRQGEQVAERYTADTSQTELAELMVGRAIETVHKQNRTLKDALLMVTDISVAGPSGKRPLERVSLELASGEILGIAGVSGNGQRELVDALVGLRPLATGQILLEDTPISTMSVAQRRALGVGYMAEDRMAVGLASKATVAENMIAGQEASNSFSSRGFLRPSAIRQEARRLIDAFDIRTPGPHVRVGSLSGGNQQKIIVARELSARPRLLIVENPCWGVDVGAIAFIQRQLLELASEGVGIVLVSNDLAELFALCDRVGVMFDGRLNRVFQRSELDALAVGEAMAGSIEPSASASPATELRKV